jgi:tol-pal system protein YbgF
MLGPGTAALILPSSSEVKMQRIFAGVCLALVPLSLQAGRVDDLEAEIRSLRTQLELTERREEQYRKEVEELSKKVDELSLVVSKNKADSQVEIDQLQKKISELSESLLATRQALDKIDRKLDHLLENNPQPAPAQPVTEVPVSPPEVPKGVLNYKQLYQAAVEQFQKKNYDAARSQFEAFLKVYPKTDLSDNAQFWLGECYYAQGNYQRAILEYDAVRKNYPSGNKVPAASWKIALAFDRLGNREVAHSFLKELIEKFPQSPEAEMARKKLKAWK